MGQRSRHSGRGPSMKFLRPMVAVILLGTTAGLTWADRHPVVTIAPVLSGAGVLPMPGIPATVPLSTSWYCPGVPAGELPGSAGSFTIANTSESEFGARVTLFPVGKPAVVTNETVPARGRRPCSQNRAPWSHEPSTIVNEVSCTVNAGRTGTVFYPWPSPNRITSRKISVSIFSAYPPPWSASV